MISIIIILQYKADLVQLAAVQCKCMCTVLTLVLMQFSHDFRLSASGC